jgi:hypothetical protein
MSARWHAGRMIYALANHFDWRANRMMTEFYVDGGLADLVFVTKAGYLTEIEVKLSLADLRADAKKEKWLKPRPHVARFFYAVPNELADRLPADLPDNAGVLVVYPASDRNGRPVHRDGVREARPARRVKALKLPPASLATLERNCYFRYWHREMQALGRRLDRTCRPATTTVAAA